MKLGLINPHGYSSLNPDFMSFVENCPEFHNFYHSFNSGFNGGLLVIASRTPGSFDIDLIDENHEGIDFDVKYDLVGLSGMTQQANRMYEIADEFRRRGSFIVIGGIHATLMPNEAKLHADSVVIGEGEYLWPQFVDDFLEEHPKPFYRTNQRFDMSHSIRPRYDLLNAKNYDVVSVQATRGCPKDCEFCAASKIYGNKYRYKPIQCIIEEIEVLKRIKNFSRIGFADDNLFINKKYSYELLRQIRQLSIRWFAQTDISVARDDDLLELMRESGCTTLFIGFESISEDNLKNIDKTNWKFRQLKHYSEYVDKIQSKGIGIVGAFIVGFDNDYVSSFDKLSEFIIDNRIFIPQITVLTPLPGTRLRKRLEDENRIISNDWSRYSFTEVNFLPKNMSPEELQKGLVSIYEKVYDTRVRLSVMNHFKHIWKLSRGCDSIQVACALNSA